MIFTKRCYVTSVLLCLGLAGCTPANFVQRVQLAPPPCEVKICTTVGAGPARCACRSHEQVQRQIMETWARQQQ